MGGADGFEGDCHCFVWAAAGFEVGIDGGFGEVEIGLEFGFCGGEAVREVPEAPEQEVFDVFAVEVGNRGAVEPEGQVGLGFGGGFPCLLETGEARSWCI